MINKKNLYHLFVRSKGGDILAEFKKLRNQCTGALRQAKHSYFNNLFQGQQRSYVVRKKLKYLLKHRLHEEIITKVKIEGTDVAGEALAEKFNDHFVKPVQSVCSMSASKYVLSVSDSLFLFPTDEDEVLSVFQNLKSNKSLDIYNLLFTPVKQVLRAIVSYLTHIYILALKNDTFPKRMQVAKVTVIDEAGDKNDF